MNVGERSHILRVLSFNLKVQNEYACKPEVLLLISVVLLIANEFMKLF